MAEVVVETPPLDAQYLLVYREPNQAKLIKVNEERSLAWLSRDELKSLLDEGKNLSRDEIKEIKNWICYRKKCPIPNPIGVDYAKLSAYITRRTFDYHFFFGQFVATQVGTPQYTQALDSLMNVFSKRLNVFTVLSNQVPSFQLSSWEQVKQFWISISGTPTSYFQGWTRHNHCNVRVAPILNSSEFQASSQTHLIEYSRVTFPSADSAPNPAVKAIMNKITSPNKQFGTLNENSLSKLKAKGVLGQAPISYISDEGNYNLNWRYEEDGVWRIVQWWNDTDLAFTIDTTYTEPLPYLPEPNFQIFPPNPSPVNP